MAISRTLLGAAICLPLAAIASAQMPGARITRDDIQFMQTMIDHHAQAIRVAKLAADRAANPDVRKLAASIATTHGDQIVEMQHWLQVRRQVAPDPARGVTAMPGLKLPGMLSEQSLMSLEEASGPAFDRLFLEDMIAHHEGALAMRKELGTSPGSGQEPDLFHFLSDFDSQQRAELGRLRALLAKAP